MTKNFVVRFVKMFQQTIVSKKKAGYDLKPTGKVNFVVYWHVEEEFIAEDFLNIP
jgi:hypothetical protein